ncbi:HPF/RaiA family ribosome-associated protein [Kitasatospora sp. NPDC048286]|uniref:HPF/RaiA family ribosome-associated protein n=1 Tax=Kitasatospora sp. NPDC048286 TaxID=3364047 RepID=UPI00371D899F
MAAVSLRGEPSRPTRIFCVVTGIPLGSSGERRERLPPGCPTNLPPGPVGAQGPTEPTAGTFSPRPGRSAHGRLEPTRKGTPMTRLQSRPAADVLVTTRGEVSLAAPEYARTKLLAVLERLDEPVLSARVRLTQEPNHAVAKPSTAQATLDLNGRPVRAHVAAATVQEAIDLLQDRLNARIARVRAHRQHHRHHAGPPPAAGREHRPTAEGVHRDIPGARPRPLGPGSRRALSRRRSSVPGSPSTGRTGRDGRPFAQGVCLGRQGGVLSPSRSTGSTGHASARTVPGRPIL